MSSVNLNEGISLNLHKCVMLYAGALLKLQGDIREDLATPYAVKCSEAVNQALWYIGFSLINVVHSLVGNL